MPRFAVLGLSLLTAMFPLLAQAGQSPSTDGQSSQGAFKAGSEEVLLDLVVRDKKGQPVKDLKAADIEVYDNGKRRTITSFRLIEGGSELSAGNGVAGASPETKKQLDPLRQVRLITLMFSNVGDVNGRRLCRTAALDLLKNELPQNVFMSVLVLDKSVQGLQAFTNDRELLRKAVERATGGSFTQFYADSQQVQAQLQQLLGPATAGESQQEQVNNSAPGGNTGPSGATAAQGSATHAMAQMLLNTLQLAQTSEMTDAGRAAVYGLLSAVRQQYMLPGRKSILYFSDGFAVPQGVEEAYQTVISTANRFNVSFYTIDSRGLDSTNLNDASNRQLRNAAGASRAQFGKNAGAVNPQEAKEFDTAIDAGKYNMQNTLADLASSTGGFLIANTNDFRGLLRRAVDDTETYYEVTYNPELEKYDGSFRAIQVKTERANLRIQSRAGYFALPRAAGGAGAVLAPYEVPILQALSTKPPIHAFDFHAAALHFRAGSESKCSLVLDLPLSSVTFQPGEAPTPQKKEKELPVKRMKADFAYLLLVKNANGEVIRNFRGDIPLQPAETQLEALKISHFIYKENFDLPPGRYTLEAGVLDRVGDKMSVRKSVMVMPALSPQLSISSVMTVRSLQDKQDTTAPDDPFLVSGKVVTPTLSPLEKADLSKGLSFYLVIYTDKANSAKPQLTMRFKRDGQDVGGGNAPLGEADEQGRIPYLATAASDALQPGNYEVRFVVRQGGAAAAESVTFTIQ